MGQNPVNTTSSNQALKDALYKELELQVQLSLNGINIEPEDLHQLGLSAVSRERLSIQAASDAAPGITAATPGSAVNSVTLDLPHGLHAGLRYEPESPYNLVAENGKPVIYKFGRKPVRITEVEFRKKTANPFQGRRTTDGVPFENIARVNPATGLVHVSFSVECSLKDKGEECLFCHYDNRKAILKTARQVAEVFTAAVEAGVARSIHLTGGFIPERRELEVYLDVAEEIHSRTGLKNFNGSISLGAPQDYSVFDKFKEAGFSWIGSNMEVWDRNIRKTIVPGKENQCGGYDNWLNSLLHAAKVFGKAKIHSNIIGGLEPKKTILEGVEFLTSRGILASVGMFHPTTGSGLEGHQSPEASWHLDLAHKVADLYRKNGFTLEEVHSYHSNGGVAGVLYRIEEEYFEDGKIKDWYLPLLQSNLQKV